MLQFVQFVIWKVIQVKESFIALVVISLYRVGATHIGPVVPWLATYSSVGLFLLVVPLYLGKPRNNKRCLNPQQRSSTTPWLLLRLNSSSLKRFLESYGGSSSCHKFILWYTVDIAYCSKSSFSRMHKTYWTRLSLSHDTIQDDIAPTRHMSTNEQLVNIFTKALGKQNNDLFIFLTSWTFVIFML